MKCYTFHMLCPSSARSVAPNLENQCSLLSSGARVMSVHSSHVHPMSVTNLALQVLLLVDREWCKAGLHTFPNHFLHYSYSLKSSLPPCIGRQLPAAQCATISELQYLTLNTSGWGVPGKLAGLKSRILYSSSKLREILPTPSPIVDFSCWKQILLSTVRKACSNNHLEKWKPDKWKPFVNIGMDWDKLLHSIHISYQRKEAKAFHHYAPIIVWVFIHKHQ